MDRKNSLLAALALLLFPLLLVSCGGYNGGPDEGQRRSYDASQLVGKYYISAQYLPPGYSDWLSIDTDDPKGYGLAFKTTSQGIYINNVEGESGYGTFTYTVKGDRLTIDYIGSSLTLVGGTMEKRGTWVYTIMSLNDPVMEIWRSDGLKLKMIGSSGMPALPQ